MVAIFEIAIDTPHRLVPANRSHGDEVQSPEREFPSQAAVDDAGFKDEEGVGVGPGIESKDGTVFCRAGDRLISEKRLCQQTQL